MLDLPEKKLALYDSTLTKASFTLWQKSRWLAGMVDFEKIVNTEIEIYRIEIFF